MFERLNIPYVKKYDANGVLTNPIEGAYKPVGPNRKKRREAGQKSRPFKNSKAHHLTTTRIAAYRRVLQHVINKKGRKVAILHYLPK